MPRKKVIEQSDELEAEDIEGEWDFKKILIGIGITVIVLFTLGAYVFKQIAIKTAEWNQVLGESTTRNIPKRPENINLPQGEEVGFVINELTNTVKSFIPETSSQSGIGKFVTDVQNFEIGGKSAKDLICDIVCK